MTSTSSWQLADIHHLGLTVGDLERSLHFYCERLRMTLVRQRTVSADYVSQQTGYEGVELRVASLKVAPQSPQTLELAQYMNHRGFPSDQATNRPGNSHLCLLVDDLQACYRDLEGQGVRFKSEPVLITAGPNQGGWVVYLKDPDGHMLEFFEPPKQAG